ncbi:MAG TPA: tetratricopeptide repeat protein [Thermoanaerobaculia bacterium]|nr:tetratricopeptide repeat protein [Thermoanaerobaculia bacterium]
MRNGGAVVASAVCLLLGFGLGLSAKDKPGGIGVLRDKAPKEAGLAALAEAERLAENGSWELIGIGRVYYLMGDKAKGQALFDRVRKPESSDWQRMGEIYAEAGETEKAESSFQKAFAMNSKDDTGQSEVGAWYLRNGQRDKAEELFARALERNPDDVWHYVRAAEAYLGVPRGR